MRPSFSFFLSEGGIRKMLEFKNITFKIGRKTILDSVNLKAKKGRITALIGKNGSGKTSLITTACGLSHYDGEILLCGKNIQEYKNKDRAKIISFLPQMMPETSISVYSLVSMGRSPHLGGMGILSKTDKEAILSALRITRTEELSERSISSLSGGEKRRAFLALLLAQEAPILILDEPNAYLDISYSSELCTLLRELCDDHKKTILVIMHDISEATEIADDIAILDGGKTVFYGTKNELLATETIENIFGVKRYKAYDGDKTKIFFS